MEEEVTLSVEEQIYRSQYLGVPKLLDTEGAEIEESQVEGPQGEHGNEEDDAAASLLLLADLARVKKE